MDYRKTVLCEVGFNLRDDDDKIPEIEPFMLCATEEDPAKTVRDYLDEGIKGIYKLTNMLSWADIEAKYIANSITFELSQCARKILDSCDESSYAEYLCALHDLEAMMPYRTPLGMHEVYDCGATSFFDFIKNYSAEDHYYVLDAIIEAYETAPVYRYEESTCYSDFLKANGNIGVCYGMHVIVETMGKDGIEYIDGYVHSVINHVNITADGIPVELDNGIIGFVKEVIGK